METQARRRVVVYHGGYGCETGCCGHFVEVDGVEVSGSFDFLHPYGRDPVEFAKDLIRQELDEDHVADLDWDNCLVIDC